jgi:hypothetical protein
MSDATALTLVRRLGTVGSDLPRRLAAQIVAQGREVTPLLLRLLDGRSVADEKDVSYAGESCVECGQQHEGREWAPFHAADLLTTLRAPVAIEPMLKVLENTGSDEPLHDKIVECLPEFGVAALEPVLTALGRTTKETETHESLCCILSALGVRDERILKTLLDLLTVHPRAAAMYLTDYGDPAACPALLAVIAASEADVEDSFERMELCDMLDAYASLGGQMPAHVKARIDAWLGKVSAGAEP